MKMNFDVTVEEGLLVQDTIKYTGERTINNTGMMKTVTLKLL